jgi:uncharacterized membrane protein (DUF373 family)
MSEENKNIIDCGEGHISGHSDPFTNMLHTVIRIAARVLAVLMVLIIMWGILDIIWVLYQRLKTPPYFILNISDILATFGAFIVVMIAIELFQNIVLYLREDIIHVRLVVATALMAIARKVIVFDFKVLSPQYIYATGAVVLALGVTFWLVSKSVKD